MSFTNGMHLVDEPFLVKDVQQKKTKKGDDFWTVQIINAEGSLNGMVWANKKPFCEFRIGRVSKFTGIVDLYNNNLNLVVESAVLSDEEPSNMIGNMKTMVFDIECVGQPFDSLDDGEKEYLLDNLEKGEEDKERAKSKAALYSIFGLVCAVGIYCPETKQGKVMVISDKELVPEKEDYVYEIYPDEKALLTAFWIEAKKYSSYVTYNGDGFDWPYMVLRSGINRIKISVFPRRNDNTQFLDLQNVLKQSRAFKLEMLCKAFGVDNPKEEGVSGLHVHELYYDKQYQTIADYVARDAYSTSLLYNIYREYLCP